MEKVSIFILLLLVTCLKSWAKKENKGLQRTEVAVKLQKTLVGVGEGLQQEIPHSEIKVDFPEDFVVVSGRLVRYQGTEKDVIVPEGICIIGKEAFAENGEITSVHLPEGVTWIQQYAFYHCSNLKEVVIPETLEAIGTEAFGWCTGLEHIDLNAVKYLRQYVFNGCKNLRVADLSSLEELDEGAFRAAGIEEIIGLESIKKVGKEVFEDTPMYNKYLEKGEGLLIRGSLLISGQHAEGVVEIPEGIKIILDKAFYENHQIVRAVFPDTMLEIGYEAFLGCDRLDEVNMPDSIVRLGYAAFAYCDGLQQIRLSQNLSEIPANCFGGCETARITVPQHCSVADRALINFGTKGCRLTLPPDIKNIGNIFLNLDDDGNEDPDIIGGYCFYTTDILSEKNSLVRIAKERGWKLEALQLEADELTLHVGDTYVLRFNSGADAVWELDNDRVLSLEEEEIFCDRKLTALKVGTAVVTAKIYGKEYTCVVNVVE